MTFADIHCRKSLCEFSGAVLDRAVEYGPTARLRNQPESVGVDGQPLDCPVSELRAHPSYARHKLSVETSRLAALAASGDLAFKYPLIITRSRFIVDGYARWELAQQQGRATLPCVEYGLEEHQALEWLIQARHPLPGSNDFIRIELALDLETYFKDKALLNTQEGGRLKGLSKLTEAEKVDSRTEIARVARVSVGNVHKVKYILAHACAPLREAARIGEISINRAEKLSHEPESRQRESLRLLAIERGIKRKARQLVAAELAATPSKQDELMTLSDFVGSIHQLTASAPEQSNEFASIEVRSLRGVVGVIFVPEELLRTLGAQKKNLDR